MKSEKIIKDNVTTGGDLGSIAEKLSDELGVADSILLNFDFLPSKGKFYNDKIFVKKLSTIDIKNLNTMTESNANAVLNGVLSNCIVSGIDVNSIVQGDKIWFLFYLRSITFNDHPIQTKNHCKECGRNFEKGFVLKDIPVNYLSDEFSEFLELDSGIKLQVQFPTIGHEIKANQLKRNDQIIESIDSELLDISCYIKSVNGKELSLFKAYEFIKNMNPIDFVEFSSYMIDYNIGLVPTVSVECSCGNTIEKRIEFGSEFFMPKFNKGKKKKK